MHAGAAESRSLTKKYVSKFECLADPKAPTSANNDQMWGTQSRINDCHSERSEESWGFPSLAKRAQQTQRTEHLDPSLRSG
jgi:hypothetical protein